MKEPPVLEAGEKVHDMARRLEIYGWQIDNAFRSLLVAMDPLPEESYVAKLRADTTQVAREMSAASDGARIRHESSSNERMGWKCFTTVRSKVVLTHSFSKCGQPTRRTAESSRLS